MNKPILKWSHAYYSDYGSSFKAEACEIFWGINNTVTISVYEIYGFAYVSMLDAVIIWGHENIKIVTRSGKIWTTYTH